VHQRVSFRHLVIKLTWWFTVREITALKITLPWAYLYRLFTRLRF